MNNHWAIRFNLTTRSFLFQITNSPIRVSTWLLSNLHQKKKRKKEVRRTIERKDRKIKASLDDNKSGKK